MVFLLGLSCGVRGIMFGFCGVGRGFLVAVLVILLELVCFGFAIWVDLVLVVRFGWFEFCNSDGGLDCCFCCSLVYAADWFVCGWVLLGVVWACVFDAMLSVVALLGIMVFFWI